MKRLFLIATILMVVSSQAFAFCGFYVAKADASLFNKASQVIIVRDGSRTVVTMSNDYQGPVQDFAMVVPVPQVLKREQIRVVHPSLFNKFDAYSGPRMAEYYDQPPCQQYLGMEEFDRMEMAGELQVVATKAGSGMQKDYKVKVEARYKVEEYDIVLLSARDSEGLEMWLTDHGYKIPPGAREVLEPYIKNKLNFFVVKVDAEKQKFIGSSANLRPLQIEYNSSRFMLPIRLGMANSSGFQDLMVYVLSKKGRTEVTNYRTVEIPTNRNIPLFVKNQNKFGEFYKATFDRAYQKEGKNVVFLEYSWDASIYQPVKCDPCVGTPPATTEFHQAGVDWVKWNPSTNNYDGDVFFTRLHVRYDRQNFPQDLVFQETPNKTRFQGRYVVHNPPYNNSFDCEKGQEYLLDLKRRRADEMVELALLTGWNTWQYRDYLTQYDQYLERGALEQWEEEMSGNTELIHGGLALKTENDSPWKTGLLYALLFLVPAMVWMVRRTKKVGKS